MNRQWHQKTPVDQLTVIRSCVEGHTDNLDRGVIDAAKFVSRVAPLLQQLAELEPYLRGEREWTYGPNAERQVRQDGVR